MVRKVFICVVAFLALFLSSSQAGNVTKASVKKVVLFSNKAQVMRQALVKVNKGVNDIFLESIAFSVDENSLMAKVKGKGEILGVQFTTIPLEEPPQKNIREIEAKIKDLKREKAALYREVETLNKKKQFLDGIVNFSKPQLSQDIVTNFPKTEDLKSMLQFLGSSYNEISTKKESLEEKIEDLDNEIGVLQKKLASLTGGRTRTKRAIEVIFDSPKEQQIDVEVSYIVRGAWWKPLYKINVFSSEDINLVMFARIYQKTGEDWNNVELAVSNVMPFEGQRLPQPQSKYLYLTPQTRAKLSSRLYNMYQSAKSLALEDKEGLKGGGLRGEASFAPSTKRRLPLSFEYILPRKVTIKSGDRESIYPLFSKKIKGEVYHYAVPLKSPYAFLVCEAASDTELISGMLQVYHNDRYVGKTFLEEKKSGEDFLVNLGIDREVKIKREKIEDKIDETFFGKIERQNTVRKLTYKITVENLKKKSVKVRLFDVIPVSKTDKVSVKDVKISPKPNRKDYKDRKGVMLWELELAPSQKKEVLISYTVVYPKNSPLYGLE